MCDIYGCNEDVEEWVDMTTTVINVENQRLDAVKMDICEECREKIIHNYGSILKGIKDDEYIYKIHIRNRLDDKGSDKKVVNE